MSGTSHCFELLLKNKLPSGDSLPAMVAAYGDDGFLRRETVTKLLQLGGCDPDAARIFNGDECEWIDIHDELATPSLFDDADRVCVVQSADKLVKSSRAQLEKWAQHPAPASSLLLQLDSFPANTNLYKFIQKIGWCVHCGLPTGGGRSKQPDLAQVKKWIASWGQTQHDVKLTAQQATLVLDAVGPDCGLLHQELAKLALYADANCQLTDQTVRQRVGSWRTRTMWEIADAVADGRVADALEQLQRVFAAGEHPAAVIPQISWSLRRFGTAANLILQGKRTGQPTSVQSIIKQCGFWGNDARLAEQRLRRMGLSRASNLLPWLLELDLKIKGSHSSPTRAIFALEELCLRLA